MKKRRREISLHTFRRAGLTSWIPCQNNKLKILNIANIDLFLKFIIIEVNAKFGPISLQIKNSKMYLDWFTALLRLGACIL